MLLLLLFECCLEFVIFSKQMVRATIIHDWETTFIVVYDRLTKNGYALPVFHVLDNILFWLQLPIPHCVPLNPSAQLQLKLFTRSVQVPLFLQGWFAQSSISVLRGKGRQTITVIFDSQNNLKSHSYSKRLRQYIFNRYLHHHHWRLKVVQNYEFHSSMHKLETIETSLSDLLYHPKLANKPGCRSILNITA